jgi:UDPglucose--hexose-1-phosphate uridylyltransferase
MTTHASAEFPHRRYNPLTGEWVLVSPHRMRRPWQGAVEPSQPPSVKAYDADCYLCPNNQRANGEGNPEYSGTFVFTNDYPAVLPDSPVLGDDQPQLLHQEAVHGTCRVLCFSPRHNLTLAEMSAPEIRAVIEAWCEQTAELGAQYRWVQVFENKGELMGASNPHPHGQIWALDSLPTGPATESAQQRAYLERNGRPLLLDYAELELQRAERVVMHNDDWVVIVPYWAVWPFETLLLPRAHVPRLPDLTESQRNALTDILKRLLTRYDNLFQTSFPYSMGWHGAAFDSDDQSHWQLHAHFYPPLLRSATIKKFMVGFEMLGESQRDLTPEQAAVRLRELSDTHFRAPPQ